MRWSSRSASDDCQWMVADRPVLRGGAGADQAARGVHVPRLRKRSAAAAARLRTGGALVVPPLRCEGGRRADLARLRVLAARVQLLRNAGDLRDPTAPAPPALQSAEARRGRARAR